MILSKTRFGEVEYSEDDILTFEQGLIGFPGASRFVVLGGKPDSPFRWLQSLDEPALAFLVADPNELVPDYAPVLTDNLARQLEMTEETPRLVFTTANIPKGRPKEMTLNLAGPLLINAITRQGKQIVLEDGAYTTRHRVFQEADRVNGNVAA